MRRLLKILAVAGVVTAVLSPMTMGIVAGGTNPSAKAATKSPLRLTRTDKHGNKHVAHMMPTVQLHHEICPATCGDSGPLLYHGGPIMRTSNSYAIFWAPPTLQSGNPATQSAAYQTWMKAMLQDIGGHGIYNIATQYTQTGPLTFIQNTSYLGGFFIDTSPYPASGCTDTGVPVATDCITDTQIQAEITKVKGIKGWTGALNHFFFVFTAKNEGSCFTAASTSCAYTAYCAYHSYYGPPATPTIYGNEPYGKPSTCLGTATSPSGGPEVTAALTALSHEHQEAVTDPELDAWWTAAGNENGDLCAYVYGTNTWDGGLANQDWNGHFYEIQEEWSNHTSACLQVGP